MWFILLLLPCSLALSDCFEAFPNKTLIGSAIILKNDVSLKQCQNACLEMDAQRCRSLTYTEQFGRCELNSEDKDEHREGFFPSRGRGDYYHRTCYDKPSVAVLRDASLFEDNCYEVTKGKVLIGIVDQLIQDMESLKDCQKACQGSQARNDIVCKSAAYYPKEKECIIASQSRHDIPDLYIDDENAVYIENVCLAKQDKENEVKKVEPNSSKDGEEEAESTEGTTQGLEEMGRISTTLESILTTPKSSRQSAEVDTLATIHESGYDVPSKSVSGRREEGIEKATTTEAPKDQYTQEREVATVEESGYDAPSDGVAGGNMEETVNTPKSVSVVDPKVIDSYAVETSSPKDKSYGRRLKDSRIRTCFREVSPLIPMDESRVTKAYSLEQCTDICRLCWRCLRGKKCRSVAYDSSKEMCALSLSPLLDGGENSSGMIYHNRGDC